MPHIHWVARQNKPEIPWVAHHTTILKKEIKIKQKEQQDFVLGLRG
jgi:hypothetical protein